MLFASSVTFWSCHMSVSPPPPPPLSTNCNLIFFPPPLYELQPVGRLLQNTFFSHLPVCVKSKRTTAIKMQIRSQALPRPLDVGLIADRRREFQNSYLSHPAKLSGTKVLPSVHLSCLVGISLNPHTLLSAVVLGKIKKQPLTPALVKHELSVAAAAPRWA